MADITKIREAFDKASIAVTKDGISAYFNQMNNSGWVTQEIDGDTMNIVRELAFSSDNIVFQCVKGKLVRMTFSVKTNVEKPILYPHMKDENDIRPFLDEIEKYEPHPDKEFLGFFIGADLSDEKDLMGRLGEYFSAKREQYYAEHRVTEIPKVMRWRELRKNVLGFARLLGVEAIEQEPDCEFEGAMTVYMPENTEEPVKVSGKLKEFFVKALDLCEEYEIECNIEKGFYNLVFYV